MPWIYNGRQKPWAPEAAWISYDSYRSRSQRIANLDNGLALGYTWLDMSKTYVMTVRLPRDLGLGVERYSARTGHKPAQVGAQAVDEFMRRRNFPLIDFRETALGPVAYVKGTRLAVYWLTDAVKRLRGNIQKAAETWAISPAKVRAALHYAEVYPQEIKALRDQAQANRTLLEKAEVALAKARALGKRSSARNPAVLR